MAVRTPVASVAILSILATVAVLVALTPPNSLENSMKFYRNYDRRYWLTYSAALAFEALVSLFTLGHYRCDFLDSVLYKRAYGDKE